MKKRKKKVVKNQTWICNKFNKCKNLLLFKIVKDGFKKKGDILSNTIISVLTLLVRFWDLLLLILNIIRLSFILKINIITVHID
jgi:hypothetical protein